MPTSDPHAQDVFERGYTVFEQAWSEDEVATIRQMIIERFEAEKPNLPEQLWTTQDYKINDSVSMAYTGVVIYSMIRDRPELAALLLKPEIVASLREVLGPDMAIEVVGAVVCDETRPFFAWHTHIGGYDDGDMQSSGNYPVINTADRITTLLYLDDIDDEGGMLLVYPRKVGDPTGPRGEPFDEWEGQVEVPVRKGSLVAMEQCTWHTARPMQREGLRVFLGVNYRSGRVPAPEWADPTLRVGVPHNPLLGELLEPG